MTVPAALAGIAADFNTLPANERLNLLLEFSGELPELPERFAEHPELLEKVVECQSPISIIVEVVEGRVSIHASAPPEAPTTRGFASILIQGLEGSSPGEVLDVPSDFPNSLGLTALVSPLRLRGMGGMLARIKRQVAEQT
ncbi:MAG TPA: SufE family protein [Candidatus Agrococcus pullicola]|uniref:SufE family protein n=1 Tax=Candidatus Agrococcus pullicola TaxID=2838429 RepID=A0A9D1YT37_9MICO|nr:SufE family protein [Candidatus Agrococcus pullicola]